MDNDTLDWGIADNADVPHVYLMVGEDKALTMPHTPANIDKVMRLSLGHTFVIRSDSERGYWNMQDGWVRAIHDATHYIARHMAGMQLPMTTGDDAEWLVSEYADIE